MKRIRRATYGGSTSRELSHMSDPVRPSQMIHTLAMGCGIDAHEIHLTSAGWHCVRVGPLTMRHTTPP
jgi:hypothetical protein